MILCRVIGNVVSTMELSIYKGYKLLIVQPVKPDGAPVVGPKGGSFLAIDTVQAGVGDTVIVIDEGNSARQIIDDKMAPVRSVVAGVVDEVNVSEL